MQKKFISIILSVSIVLLSVAPCFATQNNSTHSALKLSDIKAVSDTKATSPSTTVEPEDSSATRYYVNSNGNVTSSSTSINTWGNIVNDLTYSIAYSIGEVVKRLTTINNNVVNYLFSNASTGYYLWDWSPTNGVYQGAPTSSQSVISQLRAMGSSLTKMLSYNAEYNYQNYNSLNNIDDSLNNIEEVITTDGGIKVNIGDSFDWPWGMYNYYINNPSVTLARINENGNRFTQSVYTKAQGWFGNMMYFIIEHGRNMANALPLVVGGVKNNGNSDVITNSDLTTTALEHDSLWDDLDHIGANLSSHLARLAFVLASDEEIEARQAAADNQDSVVDNFIKPTGTGSASASDFADVASAGSSIKDALDSNVSAGNAFTSLDSNSDAWNWFSQSTLNSLDSSSSQNRKSANSDTPFLNSYYSDLMETLRLK